MLTRSQLVDNQACLLFDLSQTVPIESMKSVLPCHEKLWQAPTATSWRAHWDRELNKALLSAPSAKVALQEPVNLGR